MNIKNCEDIWIEIETCNMSKTIVIAVIYRHPNHQFTKFRDFLSTRIDVLSKSEKQFIIMGDMNINLNKYNIVNNITKYYNNITNAGCSSIIDLLARVWSTGESCIDHVYCSKNYTKEDIDCFVIKSNISDQFSTLVKLKKKLSILTKGLHFYFQEIKL